MNFSGSYVNSMKKVLIASAVSRQNAILISAPGWGKTEYALQAARQIAGNGDSVVFLELDPSSPPELVRGTYDPAAMLQGQLKRVVTGTPYDPSAKVVILDEVWRANDIVFDALIHATSQKLAKNPPVFWGTSNFVGKAERTEALRDRFALWLHLTPDLDVKGVLEAHLTASQNGNSGFPTWEEIEEARGAQITARAFEAVRAVIEPLVEEAGRGEFAVNPRRIVQWGEIITRNTILEKGANFDFVPDSVRKLLLWAYPTVDKNIASKWASVAMAVLDAVGARIEAYRAEAKAKFDDIIKQGKAGSLGATATVKLGQYLATVQTELARVGEGDPRAQEAIDEFTRLFADAVRELK